MITKLDGLCAYFEGRVAVMGRGRIWRGLGGE